MKEENEGIWRGGEEEAVREVRVVDVKKKLP